MQRNLHPESDFSLLPSTKPESVSPQALPEQFDVLVVGGGAAGLYAALCLPPELQVGLITKDTLSLSASDWAQGGIAAAIAPDDSPDLHFADTLSAGAGLCEPEAVQFLVEHAPACVQNLLQLGVAFDRHGTNLAMTLEAAHSRHRVLHAADTTGRAVITTLKAHVIERPNIQVLSQTMVLDLWLHPDTGHCQGVSLLYQGQVRWIRAKAVLLATGGGGQVFAQTTNPDSCTGDGVAIAWRAGAVLRDLEFVQFHPTALTKAGAPHFLISEAVRGEGAHLIDHTGERFAFQYHPAGELAPRDVVSRAIFRHLQKTASDLATAHVWLDLRPIPADTIRRRFPNIIQVCQQWGIDVLSQPIPVAPAAHYWMGGVLTDLHNRTNIPGLYAIGETASTGVHGANRLASNSLLECLVFSAQLHELAREIESATVPQSMSSGALSSQASNSTTQQLHPPCTMEQVMQHWPQQHTQILHWRKAVPRLVWQSAGICREARSLHAALEQLQHWQQAFTALPISQYLLHLPAGQAVQLPLADAEQHLRMWGEVRNLLQVGYLILRSSLFRTESRGGHYRSDYPDTEPQWQVHTLIQHHDWQRSAPITFPCS